MTGPLFWRWGGAAAVALLVLLVAAFLFGRSQRPDPRLLIQPAEATAVTEAAAQSVGQSSLGEATAVVVSAGRALIAAAPATPVGPVEVRIADGTPLAGRVAVDPLSGIAILDVPRSGGSALDVGDSESLRPGQQLIVAPGAGAATVQVTYVGRNTVALENFGLEQSVLELVLPANTAVAQGAVIDGDGRVVGIIAPERQGGVATGRKFAIPIEQAYHLFVLLGYVPSPTPPIGGLPAALLGRAVGPLQQPTPRPAAPLADD